MLLDVWMPRMDGLQVLAKLKGKKRAPRIIVMTSDDTPETLLGAIRQHAFQYVRKPVEPQALRTLVRDAVAFAFRELLLNAVEWGGKLDPKRKVRIAYLRAKRMLIYPIADPGRGFTMQGLDGPGGDS